MAKRNRLAEAFNESGNLIGLASVVALTAATGAFVPLLVGAVAEAGYLLFVPDSSWYQKRLTEKELREAREAWLKRRNELLPTLRPEDQSRFVVLERTRAEVEQHEPEVGGDWHKDVVRKLDYLLERYLHFASRAMRY